MKRYQLLFLLLICGISFYAQDNLRENHSMSLNNSTLKEKQVQKKEYVQVSMYKNGGVKIIPADSVQIPARDNKKAYSSLKYPEKKKESK